MVLMVLALTLGLFGISTILTAYTVLVREVSVNYLSTRPASAQLELDRVDALLVQKAARQPGIQHAEASSTFTARVQAKGGRWFPVLLFVVPDFEGLTLNRFRPETGQWPPQDGQHALGARSPQTPECRERGHLHPRYTPSRKTRTAGFWHRA